MSTPEELDEAIANAREVDDVRSIEGAVAANYQCPRTCPACEGLDHHYIADCDEHGEPLMVCKHCPAWRNMTDADLEEDL